MGDFDKYLDEAKDLAKEAGEAAKTVAGEVVDKDSVVAEIKKVIEKVQPSDEPQTDDLEQQWIARAKDIAFNACLRALDALA